MKETKGTRPSDLLHLVGTSLALAVTLIIVRAVVIPFQYLPIPARAVAVVLASHDDLLYVAAITIIFLGGFLAIRGRPWALQGIRQVFLAVALFSLLVAITNVRLVPMLGRPLNYQWLYYSDFLRSQEARNAVLAELSWKLALAAVAAIVGLLVLSRALAKGLMVLQRSVGWMRLTLAAVAVLLIYFSISSVVIHRRDWNRALVENPVVSFAHSVIVAGRSPKLLTMRTLVGTEDFEPAAPSSPLRPDIASRGAGISNVILVVLESVGAQYVEPFGASHPSTPMLSEASAHAALFTNIYAHSPETSHSMVSLLMSIYPDISYKSVTVEAPGLRFPSLSSELKQHGYRTAFFNAADLRYQNCGAFLAHRRFDRVEDFRGVRCDTPVLSSGGKIRGQDDMCTAHALIDWIASDPTQPYFAVLWTMMTHYPYFAGGPKTDFGVPEKFNDYLNALHYDDSVVGRLLHALEERHLDRSTLVVVVGDHGEAFGQHNQWSHGRCIYEENVHVPLMLINPSVFHGERSSVLGGIIDIAPTVLEILGLPVPAQWQGRSLWSPKRSGRVYFFAAWSDHVFGLREEQTKVIYKAEDNRFEIYDLAKDPLETVNRASQRVSAIAIWEQRLASWVQYQSKLMRVLEADKAR